LTMAKTKVRKLKKMETSKTEPVASGEPDLAEANAEEVSTPSGLVFVASKKPVPSETVAKEVPPPKEPEPVACEKPTPRGEAAREAPSSSGSPIVPQVDLSSSRAEFSLRIGSLEQARESIVKSYMTMVLWPMFVALTVIVVLSSRDTDETGSMLASMEFILGVAIAMGIPLMAVSWVHGLYPKGSFGRFASGSIFALLLALWLVLVLLVSNLQNTLADFGVALKLEWLFVLICLTPIFYFGGAVSELVDDRRAWRRKMGAEVKDIPLDLQSRFLDFDRRIGTCGKGNAKAWRAYLKFLVIPIAMLVVIDYVLNGLDLEAEDVIVASVSSAFGTVLLFGTAMVLIRFLHGFYPCGSLSRAVFGLASVPVLIMFAWAILINSGIENGLEQNYFTIDMTVVMLPVLMFVMFLAVFEVSELMDRRRAYRRSVGLVVKPYVPGELYNRHDDFRTFYASFANGASEGRIVLYKYALQILAIVILVAIGVSVYQSPDSGGLNETVKSYLNPPDLDNRMDNMIFVLLILAIANTVWEFLAWSYRAGSCARLAYSGVVALLASQWAYSFWTSLAKIIQSKLVTDAINYVMFAAFGFIMIRAVREVYKGYLKSRNRYLDWRLTVLREEISVSAPPAAPAALSSTSAPPRNVNGRGA